MEVKKANLLIKDNQRTTSTRPVDPKAAPDGRGDPRLGPLARPASRILCGARPS
jgi:hypothetical protein